MSKLGFKVVPWSSDLEGWCCMFLFPGHHLGVHLLGLQGISNVRLLVLHEKPEKGDPAFLPKRSLDFQIHHIKVKMQLREAHG